MTEKREITITIVRTNPETGMKPKRAKYTIPYADKIRVMDALNYIRENIDSSLAFRFSCRYYAKCGTCAAMINGKPGLTCHEPIASASSRMSSPRGEGSAGLCISMSR